jgi:hypothetical protein
MGPFSARRQRSRQERPQASFGQDRRPVENTPAGSRFLGGQEPSLEIILPFQAGAHERRIHELIHASITQVRRLDDPVRHHFLDDFRGRNIE